MRYDEFIDLYGIYPWTKKVLAAYYIVSGMPKNECAELLGVSGEYAMLLSGKGKRYAAEMSGLSFDEVDKSKDLNWLEVVENAYHALLIKNANI